MVMNKIFWLHAMKHGILCEVTSLKACKTWANVLASWKIHMFSTSNAIMDLRLFCHSSNILMWNPYFDLHWIEWQNSKVQNSESAHRFSQLFQEMVRCKPKHGFGTEELQWTQWHADAGCTNVYTHLVQCAGLHVPRWSSHFMLRT